jgi:hypothetical protein
MDARARSAPAAFVETAGLTTLRRAEPRPMQIKGA